MTENSQNKPKLTYFDADGRVFGLRVAMFKAFGKDGWVDHRFPFSDWAEVKKTTPLGQVPVLTLPDGSTVTQTEAITRWAGKQVHNLKKYELHIEQLKYS